MAKTQISGCPPGVKLGDALKNDSADLADAAQGISFAVAGAIKITDGYGNTTTIPADSLVAGVQHSMVIVRLWSTGTTATGILLFY